MFRTLINQRASRSIKTWGLAEAPTWMVWRRSFISRRLLTKEQVSRLESRNLKPYIVHVAQPTGSSDDLLSYYQTFLPKTAACEESRMLYTYDLAMKGFAAYLSPEEVKAMEKIPGFLSVKEPRGITFPALGLNQNMGFRNREGKRVITTVTGWKSMCESVRKEMSQRKTQEANLAEETNSSN